MEIAECCAGRKPWPLLIHGSAGVGKTCAALCVCDHCHGRYAYYDMGELADQLRQAKLGELEWSGTHDFCRVSPAHFWESWRELALAVIDEIAATTKVKDHPYDTLKAAMENRYSKPLILISNANLNEIARAYDDRIASRLSEGTVVELVGPDRRINRQGC